MTEPPRDPYDRYRPRPPREQYAQEPYGQPGYDDYRARPSNGQAGRPRFVPAPPEEPGPPTSIRYANTQQAPTQRASRPLQSPYEPPPPPQQLIRAVNKVSLTAAEKFWYVLGCISFGAAYFAKIPAKKALSDFGMAELTGAEAFWYVLQCIAFGAGYFAKLPTAKAISELEQFRKAGHAPMAQPERGAWA
jgi:hypothetical protein